MADLGASADQETDVQFWQDLSKVLSGPCDTHEQIDDALRGWLDLASAFRDRFGDLDSGVLHCAHQLIHRPIFQDNKDYVRVQIIFSFLQEDEPNPLHIIANFLLADGRSDDTVFGRMISEGCFPRLLDFLNSNLLMDPPLYHTLLELMYEMCRMERLRTTDLLQIDDSFIARLLQLVKEGSGDSDDPYQYSVIRVLLVLNEQYMLAATEAEAAGPLSSNSSLTNRVIKLLSLHGSSFRAFGENIILLLNRETETSQQLLILKVLYLLFTTKATYESFYTNDLKVLVDIILRNLMDLPDEKISLRHTYLRVLYPLLAHTQLNQSPNYKREEILKALRILAGSGNAHFAPTDETTLRLVDRVHGVPWLSAGVGNPSPDSPKAKAMPKLLGISLSDSRTASSVSVVDVAAVMEKPGIKTPSRKSEFEAGHKEAEEDVASESGDAQKPVPVIKVKKALPEVPKHRHGVPFQQRATLHVNGTKKTPPKAPPPRRWGKGVKLGAKVEGSEVPGPPV